MQEEYFAAGVLIGDRYEILSILGEGGMGVVYLAEDKVNERLSRKVVLKFPKHDMLNRKGFIDRFEREVGVLMQFEHANVLRVYDVGTHHDIPYMVLAYMSGGTLDDRLQNNRVQSPDEVMRWLPKIAEALDRLHEAGYLHRDVKPANILFDSHGSAFVADFGVVKVLADLEGTAPGDRLGSAEAMAPEWYLDTKGPPYDQFALAASVYRALAGQKIFSVRSEEEYLGRLIEGEPNPIRGHAANVPEAAAAAVMKALSHKQADRFPSCMDFANAFGDGLQRRGTDPMPVVTKEGGPQKKPKNIIETPAPKPIGSATNNPQTIHEQDEADSSDGEPTISPIRVGIFAVAVVALLGGVWLYSELRSVAGDNTTIPDEGGRTIYALDLLLIAGESVDIRSSDFEILPTNSPRRRPILRLIERSPKDLSEVNRRADTNRPSLLDPQEYLNIGGVRILNRYHTQYFIPKGLFGLLITFSICDIGDSAGCLVVERGVRNGSTYQDAYLVTVAYRFVEDFQVYRTELDELQDAVLYESLLSGVGDTIQNSIGDYISYTIYSVGKESPIEREHVFKNLHE